MGTIERNQALYFAVWVPAGSLISLPSGWSSSENPSSGPLVAKVRPRFRLLSHGSILKLPLGTSTYTRFNPTGPRSEAKFAMASVPAAVGRRNPQFSSRYHTRAVDL